MKDGVILMGEITTPCIFRLNLLNPPQGRQQQVLHHPSPPPPSCSAPSLPPSPSSLFTRVSQNPFRQNPLPEVQWEKEQRRQAHNREHARARARTHAETCTLKCLRRSFLSPSLSRWVPSPDRRWRFSPAATGA